MKQGQGGTARFSAAGVLVMRAAAFRRVAALAVVGCVFGIGAPLTAAAQTPAGATWSEAWITAADGVRLHADVFRPASLPAGARTPVVLVAGPYFGASNGPIDPPVPPQPFATASFLERGYTVVHADVRGAGASGGCLDYFGAADQRDMGTVIDWAGAQPWSTGAVGMVGYSYDGGEVLAALTAAHPALRAVILMSPLSPYEGQWMNGIRYVSPATITGYGASISAVVGATGPPLGGEERDNLTSTDPRCLAALTAGIENPDRSSAFWAERELLPKVRGTRVPVLMSFGVGDLDSKPAALNQIWSSFAGPRSAWFGQWGHMTANDDDLYGEGFIGRTGFLDQMHRWFDRYLKGDGKVVGPRVVVQEGHGTWRSENAWPSPDAKPVSWTLRIGSYVDAPGNTADRRGLTLPYLGPLPSPGQGTGSWTISQPFPYAAHLSGQVTATVNAVAPRAGAHLVTLLYDIGPDGTAMILARGASLVATAGATTVQLWPQDWRMLPGHRLGLLLSGADDSVWRSDGTVATVSVTGGSLRLPFLRAARSDDLTGTVGKFVPRRQPFQIPPATIATATVNEPMPPPQEP